MPTLDIYDIQRAPVNDAVEAIRAALSSVRDDQGRLINKSVLLGEDAVLQDAMKLKIRPEEAPCIRIFYSTVNHKMRGQHGGIESVQAQLNLYFLFYVGNQATQVLPKSFQEQREDYIRWNLEYIKFNVFGDGIGIQTPVNRWTYVPQTLVCDHDTPLRYFDQFLQIPPGSMFQCSRLDLTIGEIHNHVDAII